MYSGPLARWASAWWEWWVWLVCVTKCARRAVRCVAAAHVGGLFVIVSIEQNHTHKKCAVVLISVCMRVGLASEWALIDSRRVLTRSASHQSARQRFVYVRHVDMRIHFVNCNVSDSAAHELPTVMRLSLIMCVCARARIRVCQRWCELLWML